MKTIGISERHVHFVEKGFLSYPPIVGVAQLHLVLVWRALRARWMRCRDEAFARERDFRGTDEGAFQLCEREEIS